VVGIIFLTRSSDHAGKPAVGVRVFAAGFSGSLGML